MIFIEILWESFDVKEAGSSSSLTHDLRLSVSTLLPIQLSVRQWNWNIRDSLYSLYSIHSLYSGIHTVIDLLDYTYLFWGMLSEPLSGL